MYDIIFHINKKFMNYSIFTKSKLNILNLKPLRLKLS